MRMKHARRHGWFQLLPLLVLVGFGTQAMGNQPLEEEVRSLVQHHYYHGLPYEDVHRLGPDTVPYLLRLLADGDQREYWVNTIVALGFVESSEALHPLISFLENASGEVDIDTFRALLSVPFAIGCIASNGDDEALQYLVDRVSVDGSEQPSWTFRGKDIGLLMAEKSAVGLAISGRADAGAHLSELRTRVVQSGMPQGERFLKLIDGAEDALQKIRERGRADYFHGNR